MNASSNCATVTVFTVLKMHRHCLNAVVASFEILQTFYLYLIDLLAILPKEPGLSDIFILFHTRGSIEGRYNFYHYFACRRKKLRNTATDVQVPLVKTCNDQRVFSYRGAGV